MTTARVPTGRRQLEEEIAGDERFAMARGPHVGFYRNFERALALAPDSELVALCDQDDRWRPDKLERLIAAIGRAELAYSDARVVRPDGAVVDPSYWSVRQNNHTNLTSLVLANSITGAATLFRRELLTDACHFHRRIMRPSTTTGWAWLRSAAARSPTSTSLSTTMCSTRAR